MEIPRQAPSSTLSPSLTTMWKMAPRREMSKERTSPRSPSRPLMRAMTETSSSMTSLLEKDKHIRYFVDESALPNSDEETLDEVDVNLDANVEQQSEGLEDKLGIES